MAQPFGRVDGELPVRAVDLDQEQIGHHDDGQAHGPGRRGGVGLGHEGGVVGPKGCGEHRQALGMARIHSDILSSVSDALASIISNNMNNVVKFLTGFTIIMMIPNIITGAYGMNTALPFSSDGNPLNFCIIMLASLAASCLTWWFFRKKRWL